MCYFKNFKPRPKTGCWYLLRSFFKVSDEHLPTFLYQVPPPTTGDKSIQRKTNGQNTRTVNKVLVQWERDFKLKKLLRFIFNWSTVEQYLFSLCFNGFQISVVPNIEPIFSFHCLPWVLPCCWKTNKAKEREPGIEVCLVNRYGMTRQLQWRHRILRKHPFQFFSALWLFSNSITGVVTMFALKMCLSAITLFSPRGKAFHGTISFVSLVCWQPVTTS